MSDQFQPTEMALPFQLGPWRIEPQLNRVSNGERTVQLEPRLTQVLVCLARRQGRVVPRADLLDTVWPDVVVGEENLTGAISELRRILGDDSQSPRYIETIRKGGYRLLMPVDWISDQPPVAQPVAHRLRAYLLGTAGLLTLAVIVAVGFAAWRSCRGKASGASGRRVIHLARPFTAYIGSEVMPAISDDGTRVAFAWRGEAESSGGFDVYVKQENTETPLRLTDSPGFDGWPQWSPDGTSISYYHQGDSVSGIFEVPSIGGERRLLVPGPGIVGPHSWSPDGRQIAFAGHQGIQVLDRQTGTRRRLTVSSKECCSEGMPSYSPAGDTIAFVGTDGARLQDLYLVSATGGQARRITTGLLRIHGFDWLPDGNAILASSIRSGRYSLWQVDMATGSLTLVPTQAEWVLAPTLARRASRLCFQIINLEVNLWRYRPNLSSDIPTWIGEKLISSTRVDIEGAYSPDGKRIAFTSGRSGSLELWICASDGTQPVRLTDFEGAMVAGPVWSPNGESIAFTTCPGDSCEAYVVAAGGGPARALTDTPYNTAAAGWSADSEWLYVDSDRGGEWQLFKLRLDRPAEIHPVTTDGGLAGTESFDGRYLLFARPGRPGLWRQDLAQLEEPVQIISDAPKVGRASLWDQCENGFIAVSIVGGRPSLQLFPSGSSQGEILAELLEISSATLSVSRDCGNVLIGHTERGDSDLMLAAFESKPHTSR
jgi:Tol biopolymer transport system component/DNA-binding winged helix-turn-helix (wHTH) protein